MTNLSKKERSELLNLWDRILIDFKSIFKSDEILIYKISETSVFYFLDEDNVNVILKTGDYNLIESLFMNVGDVIVINHEEFKNIVKLKKREIDEVFYDTNRFVIEYTCEKQDVPSKESFIIKKEENYDIDRLKSIINGFKSNTIEEKFQSAHYIKADEILTTSNNHKYPYRISFSDDINFKLNISESESRYHIRLINDDTFIQVLTITNYNEFYKIYTTLFAFNYYKQR